MLCFLLLAIGNFGMLTTAKGKGCWLLPKAIYWFEIGSRYGVFTLMYPWKEKSTINNISKYV